MTELSSRDLDLAALLRAAQTTPHSFAEEIANSIRRILEPAEVVVGISDQDGGVYRIKATSGFSGPAGSVPVEVPRNPNQDLVRLSDTGATLQSTPPAAVRALFSHGGWPSTCIYAHIDAPVLRLISRPGLQSPMLFVAISFEDSSREKAFTEVLKNVAPFLARLYLGALNEQKLHARERVVEQANESKDASSLMHRACRLATELFHIEGAEALLPDDSKRMLDLRAIYPRPGGIERLGSYRFQASETPTDPVASAYSTGRIEIVDRNQLPPGLRSTLPGKCDQVLILPLGRGLGVLVCAGKSWEQDGRHYCGSFLWEDVTLLEFFSDMLTILVRMLRGKDEAGLRVERTLHGAKWIITDIRQNLSLLEENGVNEMVKPVLSHTLPNAIALLDDIASQLERKRLSSLDGINLTDDTKLFSDVIAGMARFAPALSRALGRNAMKVNFLKDTGVATLPPIRCNTAALVTVFRNLVHNAVKYSKRDRGHVPWIVFDGGYGSSTIWVTVSDNGLGVEAADRDLVFEEGYRGQAAMDADPNGLGVGLSDCREILNLLGGTIAISDPLETEFGPASTTIRVELPRRAAI
jgi:histidine kinase/DNA gyrase B/HSP90-like ATPase